MLSCHNNGKLISRLIDNDLPEKEAIELQKHISTCSDCSQRYTNYVNISGFVIRTFSGTTTPPMYVHVNSTRSVIPFDSMIKQAIAGLSLVVCVLVILSVITIHNRNPGEIPVLSEVQADKMNTPLEALLYYFEHDSTTVGSQFLTISRGTIKNSTDTLQLTYSSPLFDDNSGIELYSTEHYK